MSKTLLPENFTITEDMRAWAQQKVPDVDINDQTECFCDYWRARGRMMADWQAAWRTWMRRVPSFPQGQVTRHSTLIPDRAPRKPERQLCRHGLDGGCVYCRGLA